MELKKGGSQTFGPDEALANFSEAKKSIGDLLTPLSDLFVSPSKKRVNFDHLSYRPMPRATHERKRVHGTR